MLELIIVTVTTLVIFFFRNTLRNVNRASEYQSKKLVALSAKDCATSVQELTEADLAVLAKLKDL